MQRLGQPEAAVPSYCEFSAIGGGGIRTENLSSGVVMVKSAKDGV
jgi:hypothetical protein